MRPDAKSTSITIRLTAEEKRALEQYCIDNKTTYSLLVRSLLAPYITNN